MRFSALRGQRSKELWQSNEIVCSHGDGEEEALTGHTLELGTREAANALAPAKRFFDDLAPALAHGIARMPSGAVVDGRALYLLCNVRGHAHGPQIDDEVGRVITLVGADRELPRRAWRMALDHGLGPPRARRCQWPV